MPTESAALLVDGPWRHREVTASGLRFHLAEHGPSDGPLVVLLHGFPEFWWSWRHQLVALGDAGLHVVAPDLRGYGASDKPPRGYDLPTLAADLAALVRALGAEQAHVIGHDWGAAIGWTAATLHPSVVRRLSVLSVPHPVRFEQALRSDRAQLRASAYMGLMQVPRLAERRIVQGELVSTLLHRWGGPGFPDAETDRRCTEALRVAGAAHCAAEYYRWAFRSQLRPSGRRFRTQLGRGVQVPVLQVHGAVDGCVLAASARGCEPWARAGLEYVELPGIGHFPHQEAPEQVTALLLAHERG